MKRAAGITLMVVLAPLVLFVLTGPPSFSGAMYVLAPVVLAASLVVRSSRRVAVAGAVALVGTVAFRITRTPAMGATRILDRILDERDPAIDGARAIRWTGAVRDPDVPRVADAMRAAYGEMNDEVGDVPSPFVPTLLGLQRRGASDTIEFESKGSTTAVIYLHGSAGNYAMSCWLFARAALAANVTTSCPSTRFAGDWWAGDGEAIVRDTYDALRARGHTRILLGGLSNGAIGASRLAPRMPGMFAGLVLVSGAAPDAAGSGLPTLAIHGKNDHQISAAIVRAYADRARAKYVEYDAGHFVLLVDRLRVQPVITEWLVAHAK